MLKKIKLMPRKESQWCLLICPLQWFANQNFSSECSHTAVKQLLHLVPKLQDYPDNVDPNDLNEFYSRVSTYIPLNLSPTLTIKFELQKGANDACSNDVLSLREAVANGLNKAYPTHTLLNISTQGNHGIKHKTTSQLLCESSLCHVSSPIFFMILKGSSQTQWLQPWQRIWFCQEFLCPLFLCQLRGWSRECREGFFKEHTPCSDILLGLLLLWLSTWFLVRHSYMFSPPHRQPRPILHCLPMKTPLCQHHVRKCWRKGLHKRV